MIAFLPLRFVIKIIINAILFVIYRGLRYVIQMYDCFIDIYT
jgi:hypothetical protein